MKLRKGWVIAIAAAIVMFLVIVMTNHSETPLSSYNADNDPTTAATTEQEAAIESFSYTDESTGLALEIPEDWQAVTENGNRMFVHKPTATTVQIQVMDYYPEINLISADSMDSDVTNAGGTLVNFYWADNSSFVTMYQMQNNDVTMDYVEYTLFDRATVARVVYAVNDEYYGQMEPYISYSIDSISWAKPYPIPTTMELYYMSVGSYEFGRPIGWQEGFAEGSYYATDDYTGSSYAVSAVASDAVYTEITQADYISYAGSGRQDFTVQSFEKSETMVAATSTYTDNGTQMMMRQYLYASGTFEYTLTEICPSAGYASVATLFDDLIYVFRMFS